MVHALSGKEHVEWDNPYDVGMTGLIGFSSGYYAMLDCDILLMLGTDFPYRQFYPEGAARDRAGRHPAEQIGRRTRSTRRSSATSARHSRRCCRCSRTKRDDAHLEQGASRIIAQGAQGLDQLASGRPGKRPIHPQQVAKAISDLAADDAIFTCDVGLPTVWAARYLAMNGKRRLIGSFWHGSMANAMAQAIGAQAAFPDRQVISLSGDGGFTMLMGDFLSLAQLGLPVKIVVFNNGALGFIEVEQKSTGFLATGTELKNPNFAAMAEAVGIRGIRIEDPAEVESGIAAALAHDGPVLVDAVVNADGAADAAGDHRRDGEGLHALHGEGRVQRPRRRGRRSRPDQPLALARDFARHARELTSDIQRSCIGSLRDCFHGGAVTGGPRPAITAVATSET